MKSLPELRDVASDQLNQASSLPSPSTRLRRALACFPDIDNTLYDAFGQPSLHDFTQLNQYHCHGSRSSSSSQIGFAEKYLCKIFQRTQVPVSPSRALSSRLRSGRSIIKASFGLTLSFNLAPNGRLRRRKPIMPRSRN